MSLVLLLIVSVLTPKPIRSRTTLDENTVDSSNRNTLNRNLDDYSIDSNLIDDRLGSLRSYNRRRKPPDYYETGRLIAASVSTAADDNDTEPLKHQNTKFLKEFLKRTSTFLSLSEFLQSKNLTLVEFLKKTDHEIKQLLINKPLVIQKGSSPVKKNKLALKPQIVQPQPQLTTTMTTTTTTTAATVNDIDENEMIGRVEQAAELYDVFKNAANRKRLLRILRDLNMTLDDLMEHRERGSSNRHLAEMFHRNAKEPDVRSNGVLVIERRRNTASDPIEAAAVADSNENADLIETVPSAAASERLPKIILIPVPVTTNRPTQLPSPPPPSHPPSIVINPEDILLISLTILTIILIVFLLIYTIVRRLEIRTGCGRNNYCFGRDTTRKHVLNEFPSLDRFVFGHGHGHGQQPQTDLLWQSLTPAPSTLSSSSSASASTPVNSKPRF